MSCKDLLQTYLSVFDHIKVRIVQDEELKMLVTLCQDLVKFHDVLVRLDYKVCLTAWKSYLKLLSKYQARLRDQLDLAEVTEKISSVLSTNYRDLNTRANQVSPEESPAAAGVIPSPEGDSLQMWIEPEVELQEETQTSPEPKRRKLSEKKENIKLAMIGMEDSITFLLDQNRRDLRPFRESIEYLNRRITDIVEKNMMIQIETLVYFDIESTGLQSSGQPRITELSLVAVKVQDVLGELSVAIYFLPH